MFYKPVLNNRWFKPEVRYADIDWTDFSAIVAEWEGRIREWYLQPARALQGASGHFAFPVMALACMLVDTLSQFYTGAQRSHRTIFLDFVQQRLPRLDNPVSPPIQRPPGLQPPQITNTAEALYYGFRCGILHEAHVTPYGAILGLNQIVQVEPAGFTTYADGTDCPTIIFDPHRTIDALELFFQQ